MYWDKVQPIFVDNKGNVILFDYEESIFLLNETNQWKEFNKKLQNFNIKTNNMDVLKFGQETIVAKFDENILIFRYNEFKLTSSQLIKHKAVNIEEQCDLENIIVPNNSKYLIINYELSEARTFIVWDTEKNMEHTNFLGRKEDLFLDYIIGKNSKLGFI